MIRVCETVGVPLRRGASQCPAHGEWGAKPLGVYRRPGAARTFAAIRHTVSEAG
jgi:hypothetical protein